MKTRMLGVLATGVLLGISLATTGLAQDRQRGFDEHAAGAGPMRGPLRNRVRSGADAPAQAERFITQFDTDADGRVSAAEFSESRLQQVDRYFERRDTDGDGLVSVTEFEAPRTRPERSPRNAGPERPAIDEEALTACVRETIADFEPRRGGEADDPFAAIDANADNALSLQEVSAAFEGRAQEQFVRLDADEDGYVTADEAGAQGKERMNLRRVTRACLREQRAG